MSTNLRGRPKNGENQHILVKRLEAYFQSNPEEELTVDDAVGKFDSNYGVARQRLKDLQKSGFLAQRKEGRTVIYSKAGAQ